VPETFEFWQVGSRPARCIWFFYGKPAGAEGIDASRHETGRHFTVKLTNKRIPMLERGSGFFSLSFAGHVLLRLLPPPFFGTWRTEFLEPRGPSQSHAAIFPGNGTTAGPGPRRRGYQVSVHHSLRESWNVTTGDLWDKRLWWTRRIRSDSVCGKPPCFASGRVVESSNPR